MSQGNLTDYVQVAIAAIKAALGDWKAMAMLAIKYAPKIIAVLLAVIILIVALPVLLIQSLFTGSDNSSTSTFTGLASDTLQFGEDWVKVLAVAQTKKSLSGSDKGDIHAAADAVRNGSIEAFLAEGENNDDGYMDLYNNNYELLDKLLSNYAGYVSYYDELPAPSSYESIVRVQDPATGLHVLEASIKVKTGTIKKDPAKRIFEDIDIYETRKTVIYSSHDVQNFKIEDGIIKLRYRKFNYCAYFPVPGEYSVSFSDDFDTDRVHDGKHTNHEGIDIFASRNTPVVSIEDCNIEKIGWDSLGGWRMLLESNDGQRQYYYAHLEDFAPKLQEYKDYSGKVFTKPGISVKAGELLGYIGSSGSFNSNSPPGSDTGTPPHLHFQLWVVSKGWFSEEKTLLNPYYTLKLLENSKYTEAVKRNMDLLESEGL